jgi:hypothetical protein
VGTEGGRRRCCSGDHEDTKRDDDARSSRRVPERRLVPPDDLLAESADPRAELASFLPLKGSAGYKRQVAEAIAASRFADANFLRELPAVLAFSSAAQAPEVADLLQKELGDDAEAWEGLVGKMRRLTSNATKSLSALIEEIREDRPSA